MIINPDSNTEQLILETAEKLFLEKGFALTSTTEIARVAGCNQALVHYYFRTKENLFNSVFEKKVRLFATGLLQVDQPGISFEQKLKHMIEAHFDMLSANPGLPFLVFNELITNPERLKKLHGNMLDLPKLVFFPLKAELEVEIAKGNIRPMTIYDLILTVVSLNVMLFIASPIFKILADLNEEAIEKLIVHRRQENVTIILQSLKNNI